MTIKKTDVKRKMPQSRGIMEKIKEMTLLGVLDLQSFLRGILLIVIKCLSGNSIHSKNNNSNNNIMIMTAHM